MLQSLLFKEWIKTRRIVLLLGVIFAGMIIYTLINTGQAFRVNGAVQTWAGVILKDAAVLPSQVKWLPVLAGILLGISQFSAEMVDKRLKLTLHLPLTESRIMSVLLAYGLGVLFLLFSAGYLFILWGLSSYYPHEILTAMSWFSFPHMLGGFFGYLFAAWICVEPVWRQRIGYTFVAVAFLSLLYIEALSGAYLPFLPFLLILLLISFTFPFYSMARFKEGAQ